MKKSFLLTLLFIFVFSVSASAQNAEYASSRLSNFASQLKRSTVDLADRTAERLKGYTVTRADIEEAFLAGQLDAGASLFSQMVNDNRRVSELRDAAVFLSDLTRRAPSYGSNNYLWRNAQTAISDINRELGGAGNTGGNNNGGNSGGSNGGNDDNRPVIGRAFWRGIVDDRVQLVLRDRSMRVETVSGRAYPDGTSSFTAALPDRRVSVEVNKQKGRGSVRVLQQPSRDNDFTAVIEIYDDGGGAKEYQLEISWRRE